MDEGVRYKDKVTIVTGGSSGIGKGCVEVFVKHGSKVVFCSNAVSQIKDELIGQIIAEGKSAEEEINKKGLPGKAMFIFCDVTKEEDVKALINKTVETFGQIDCLINNAGWHPPYQTIDDTSADDFRKLVDLNLIGYYLVAKYALPHIRKVKGNVIQTGSIGTVTGQLGGTPYCATKGAISTFTKSLAIDEAIHDVRVNSICPGNTWTPLWEGLANLSGNREKMIKDGCNMQLINRLGTPEECGKACLFFATDATYCTGVDLLVTGGAELSLGPKNPLAKKPGDFC